MSDFHARVMNIQAVEMCKGKSGADRVRNLCYKEGHKSARHAAAEIANEADAAIAAKDAEIARLREALIDCIPALEIGLESSRVISIFGDDRPDQIRDALAQARAALAGVGRE